MKNNNKLQPLYLPYYNHICSENKCVPQCHVYATYTQLFHVYIWDNYASIYTSNKLIWINYVTRSTGIYTFDITDICSWTNMPGTLDKHVPRHFFCILNIDPTLLHIPIKISKLQHLFSTLLQNMWPQQICPHVPQIGHIPKLLDVHLWEKYANIHATYEVASINDVARIAVHIWWQWCWRTRMMVPQPYCIYWVGH